MSNADMRDRLTERLIRQDTEGARDDATETLVELARLWISERNGAAAAALLPRLLTENRSHRDFESTAEELKHLIAQCRVSGDSVQLFHYPTSASDQPAYVAVKLLQAGAMTAGEYIVVLEELGRSRPEGKGGIRSVLHVLQERGAREVTSAALFVSKDSETPLVPLSRFRPQADAFGRLPLEFAARRGAIAFNTLDTELLVAVLNPYDMALRSDVVRVSGGSCSFFLATPADYDDTLYIVTESSPQ